MKEIVKIQGLQKSFGKFKALHDVSFTVNADEVVGFIGPNGAGKSTTIRILLLIHAMKEIVNEFYLDNSKIVNYLPQMEQILSELPIPEYTTFVLVDIDPSQFIAQKGIITGLVDTEAYVIAPREFDFIALEYVLDSRSAKLISEGYESILPIPDLRSVRTVYRYLYRLIEIQGDDDIDEWLLCPIIF